MEEIDLGRVVGPPGEPGTTDYAEMENKPSINGTVLEGDRSPAELGLAAAEEGKGLSSNDYTDGDKEAVAGLNGLSFGQDGEGNWGYIAPGADTVTPFNRAPGTRVITSPTGEMYYFTYEAADGNWHRPATDGEYIAVAGAPSSPAAVLTGFSAAALVPREG